jgi:hypothetical protein
MFQSNPSRVHFGGLAELTGQSVWTSALRVSALASIIAPRGVYAASGQQVNAREMIGPVNSPLTSQSTCLFKTLRFGF